MHAIQSTSNHNHSTHHLIRLNDCYMPVTMHSWYYGALQDHVLARLHLATARRRIFHLFDLFHLLNLHRSDALNLLLVL